MWSSAQFGGQGGGWFSDVRSINTYNYTTAVKLDLWYSNVVSSVAAIQITCKKGTLGRHGTLKHSGYQRSMDLSEGEGFVRMEGTYYNRLSKIFVSHLKFTTSLGRVIATGTPNGQSFSVVVPHGYQIVGFFGRKGHILDAVGVIAYPKYCTN